MTPTRTHTPATLLAAILLLLPASHAHRHTPPSPAATALLPANTALLSRPHPLNPPPAQPSPPAALHHHHHQQHVLQKRAPNWATVTVYVNTLTAYADAPTIVTVTVNGTDQAAKTAATVTVGTYTQTLGQQSPQPTSTKTVFLGAPATSTTPYSPVATGLPALPADRACYPGESSQRYPGTLSLTRPTQTTTLLVMALFLLVMLVCWNLFFIRLLIFPLKLVVISWHELGHIVLSIFAGHTIKEVDIDPNVGGTVKLVQDIVAPRRPSLRRLPLVLSVWRLDGLLRLRHPGVQDCKYLHCYVAARRHVVGQYPRLESLDGGCHRPLGRLLVYRSCRNAEILRLAHGRLELLVCPLRRHGRFRV
ncbi:hypothetical protein PTTG_00057 [Puccinia triticina 1-1 BBBD Race 1]|uniref:Peptidase M50 domain-containing protein n=1 Tax=Puccinia triticina (isolate 1-1 / race 1 (BBBD)) TaxID=630390 RepID=A0A180GW11_PUCT1|nr:hypothetical protein PTTG_00057 [Puccinia triticina 1-1 BBBD Race 1]